MRARAKRFRNFVEALSSGGADLPLVHTTSAYSFQDICEANELKATSKCRHFHEDLVYLFYGRPSYRTQESKSSRLKFNYPFIFIFDPRKVSQIRRVFPFDTGAFDDGGYQKFFDKSSRMEDFELPPHLEYARKLAHGIYGSQKNYMLGRVEKNLEIPLTSFEAQGVIEQTRLPPYLSDGLPDEKTIDERSTSIEVQVESPLEVTSCIQGLVLPQVFLDDESVVRTIKRWGPEVLRTYEVIEMHSPGSWMSLIYNEVYRAYEELGYFEVD